MILEKRYDFGGLCCVWGEVKIGIERIKKRKWEKMVFYAYSGILV